MVYKCLLIVAMVLAVSKSMASLVKRSTLYPCCSNHVCRIASASCCCFVKWYLPSNSTINRLLRKKKSTIYGPITYWRLHFCPSPLDFATDQNAASASVILLRLALALSFKIPYSITSAVYHFMGRPPLSPLKGENLNQIIQGSLPLREI